MLNHKIEIANKQIRFVTNLGIVVNIALSAMKITVGVLTSSIALVADGVHSFSDMVTDLAVLLGVRFGSKKPDSGHPYGHGRAETFSAGLIATILVIVGGSMIYYAGAEIARGSVTEPRMVMMAAAVISIVAKEWLYRITKKTAIDSHSSALYANALHHRSDALSSVAVLVGFISLKFGFVYGDQIAAIAVGLMIILVGIRVAGDCLRELTEGSVDSATIGHIEEIINSNPSIRQWHKLRTRMVGREVFLDLHILVDPGLNIAAAHGIAENLENALDEEISRPVNITVHIEPDTPELRK